MHEVQQSGYQNRADVISQGAAADWGQIGGGILMMVGAVAWFVIGYWAGYIYFYPPILFCAGLWACVKGA
jgi:hypothetical protein